MRDDRHLGFWRTLAAREDFLYVLIIIGLAIIGIVSAITGHTS